MTGADDVERPANAGPGPAVLAVDVGGTDLKAGLLGSDGGLDIVVRRPTPRHTDAAEAVVAAVAAVAEDFRRDGHRFSAIGVTVPGIVDEDAGIGVRSTNLGWRDFPFRDRLRMTTGIPIALAHDVRAAGAAEHRLGAARGTRDAAVVTVGTGVAAALVVGGRPYRGRGYAGEIGHSVVWPDGPLCRCGQRGCLEAIGSARAIVERYTALTGETVGGAAEVVTRSEAGDAHAALIWKEAIDALAMGLAQLSAVLAPELVVIGGGLSEAREALLRPLRDRLAAVRVGGPVPRIARAELGQNAGVWGAALAARDHAVTAP